MPNNEIKRLNGCQIMNPNHKQQLEGDLKIKFKLQLIDTEQDYRIIIKETNSLHETELFRPVKNLELARSIFDRVVKRLFGTNQWNLMSIYDGPDNNKSIIFEYAHLMTWGVK